MEIKTVNDYIDLVHEKYPDVKQKYRFELQHIESVAHRKQKDENEYLRVHLLI